MYLNAQCLISCIVKSGKSLLDFLACEIYFFKRRSASRIFNTVPLLLKNICPSAILCISRYVSSICETSSGNFIIRDILFFSGKCIQRHSFESYNMKFVIILHISPEVRPHFNTNEKIIYAISSPAFDERSRIVDISSSQGSLSVVIILFSSGNI